jgi:hypothetical protein
LLKAGEYRLYSDKKLPEFKGPLTETSVKLNNSGIRIFPNPVTDLLQIEAQDMIQDIELISVDGKILRKFQPNATVFSFELNGLKSGLLILRIKTLHQVIAQKIVKN